ncbi:hsp70 family protein [Neorhodopirellula pilleata]|uniref:Chaperone protein DnaK n=1 Tax=Neorhodopirellula pilleata TaxID=2714738 RepID=A0A5C6A453_9BACT|nr:hsp70 family protein [Neorhodopirellula pilleata]TWT94180.1 Chaperone protein DnaK [Neorhodopirellula pilleata]
MTPQSEEKYCIGIDLGTTNCVLAFIRPAVTEQGHGEQGHGEQGEGGPSGQREVEVFAVPQWVDLGTIQARTTLPSFHYTFTDAERTALPSGGVPSFLKKSPNVCVGEFARIAGTNHPGRLIASAKSWLSHEGVDRTADLLPWHGDEDVPRQSPKSASASYLDHLRRAWDAAHPEHPMAEQDVVITLPASFDEVARELTVAAAAEAGLPKIQLIEEPQAAFYAWLDRNQSDWTHRVRVGQSILVCDIGGGTTDLTLIRVRKATTAAAVGTNVLDARNAGQPDSAPEASSESQTLQFHRVAVGKHLILGGDNLDLAVAKLAESKLAAPLAARQWQRLVAVARDAKETMLSPGRPTATTLNVAGEGASLIGGSVSVSLTADDIDEALLEGFFPPVSLDSLVDQEQSGFQELGLPYATDPAITKHLAQFLRDHRETGRDDPEVDSDRVDLVLFNGGVLRSNAIQDRVIGCLASWFAGDVSDWKPQVLAAPRLDLSVAQGAAYYALVRRGEGVRIAANLARTYFMQISQSPPRAVCVIPADAQGGQRYRIDSRPMNLRVGTPVRFPLWVSSTRLVDRPGDVVEIDESEMTALPPIQTALRDQKRRKEASMEIVIESELSEIGTIGLFCVAVDRSRGDDGLRVTEEVKPKRWKLDFDIRATLETDRVSHEGSGEASGILDEATIDACIADIHAVFINQTEKPSKLVKRLQATLETKREHWPPVLLRKIWEGLIAVEPARRLSASHEARWLNLLGYSLRPGYGVAVDDWRTSQTWRLLQGKIAHDDAQTRAETMILWRRICGGLTAGQQSQLSANLRKNALTGARAESGETLEAWRLAGSLERLPQHEKQDLAHLAIEQLQRKKALPIYPALFWAVGRIASRQPGYGPINLAVSDREAASIVCRLLALPIMQNVGDQRWTDAMRSSASLALTQIARRCHDRFRDLDDEIREEVLRQLSLLDAPAHWHQLVREGGQFDHEEQAAIFGDSLPLGIELS